MSNNDVPAGAPGGPSVLADLPAKLRVHALAKLIGRTSKEILATLADLGVELRSPQSSVERDVAERVVTALLPDSGPQDESAVADEAADAPVEATTAEPLDTVAVEPLRTVVVEPLDIAEPATDAEFAEPTARRRRAPRSAPPAPLFQAPAPARAAAAPAAAPAVVATDDTFADGFDDTSPRATDADADDGADDGADGGADLDGADADDDGAARRRRRRGRRGRGRGKGGDADNGDDATDGDDTESDAGADERPGAAGEDADDSTDGDDEGTDDNSDDESDESAEEGTGSRRRRRRRRRRGAADSSDEPAEDPPGTVTRVRQPRDRDRDRDDDASDGVQSVRGSTRLEAKRQRRRDGRDAGRRRVPILTEAEFLARRESVDRSMVVRENGGRVEIAVLEDEVLVEHFIAGTGTGTGANGASMVGNIHLGRVQNVLPSMEAAFVDIGRGRNAVLYAGEVDWDAAGLNGKARRIEQALSTGDSILVQVTKDPIGHKGARLTTQISLAGRFLVYVPSGGTAGISRKLPDTERKRLKDMLKEIVPAEAGVIIRTASEGVSQEALERDVTRLQAQWEVVRTKAATTGPNRVKAPALLYEEPDLLVKVVRDQFNEDFTRLVVSGDDAWDTVSDYITHVAPELAERVHRHVGPGDVFTEHRVDEQLLKALDRKVWLPSGGTLVIDRTEAMTVIDVNTGKFTGSGGNLEETVTRNNLEAAEEIVRQLRLRDIGGIIVIDFIDMVLEANRDLVLRRLTECLARDRTRHQVAEVTSLGLVQMTRKRVGGGLLEHFSAPCDHCRGRGVIVSTELPESKSDNGRDRDRDGRRRGRGRRDDQRPESDERPHDPAGIAVVAGLIGAEKRADEIEPVDEADPANQLAPVDRIAPAAEAEPLRLAGDDDPDGSPATPAVAEGRPARRSRRRGGAAAVAAEAAPAESAPGEPAPGDVAAGTTPAEPDAPTAEVPVEVAAEAPAEVPSEVPVDTPAEVDRAAEARPSGDSVAAAVNGTGNGLHGTNGSTSTNGSTGTNGSAPVAPAADEEPRPKRRRGRATRTAGSPAGAAAAVITAERPAPPEAAPAAVPVPEQPEPRTESRPRRPRRAASRPAGPPVGAEQ